MGVETEEEMEEEMGEEMEEEMGEAKEEEMGEGGGGGALYINDIGQTTVVSCRPADSNFNLISATLLGSVVTSKDSKVSNSLKCVASTVNVRATVSDCARSFLRPGALPSAVFRQHL